MTMILQIKACLQALESITAKNPIKPFVAAEGAARRSDTIPHMMSLESASDGPEDYIFLKKRK